jgi:surface protein
MFSGCQALTSLDLSKFNTEKVTDMSAMFGWCNALTSLDLSKFNTHKVESMDGMFSECWDLKEIKGLESFDISCLKSAKYMFNDCRSLENFDASAIEAANINKKHMFRNCNRR